MMLEPIPVPTMMLHGANDGCMGAELVEGMAAFFPRGLRVEIVPGTGHSSIRRTPSASTP